MEVFKNTAAEHVSITVCKVTVPQITSVIIAAPQIANTVHGDA